MSENNSGMFSWFRRNKAEPSPEGQENESATQETGSPVDAANAEPEAHSAEPLAPPRTEGAESTEDAEETASQPTTAEAEPEPVEAEAETTPQPDTESPQAEPESQVEALQPEAESVAVAEGEQPEAKKAGFFTRLKSGLSRTRTNIGDGFIGLFKDKKIDDELFEELETQLLMADLGVETTMKIIDELTDQVSRKQLKDGNALYKQLQQLMTEMLISVDAPLPLDDPERDGPLVILMVGVNGVGKTTTIGKLAKQFQQQGKSVMLAAGDTFRAAAVEQLQAWGEHNQIPVIAQHTGADSASVLFDALQAARARNVDVLIADTAGRLQNKGHLMEELKKIVRVMQKLDPKAPHEVMLTLDAGTGQNAISQTQLFSEAVGITGLTLSKLDGTAKGGVIFGIADKFGIPIRYIGVGEGVDDLRPFKAEEFVAALFAQD